jgi:hypothetical protein
MTNTGGGPKTEAGKEVARWNATQHGIRSPAPMMPGLEKAEDWKEHCDGVLESLSSEGHLELVLAERVALLSWRLHRVTRYERESIALSQEKVQENLEQRRGFDPSISGATLSESARRGHESSKKTQRLLKRLPTLPDEKSLSSEEAGLILLHTWNWADQEGELIELHIPDIPQALDPDYLFDYDIPWTVSLVKEGISVLAQFANEPPEKLLEDATEEARRNVRVAKRRVDEVERDLRNMSRERLLPDETTLQKITRYEAHLSRQLFQALHELEALQTKRSGGAAPLARLDVQGLES